MENNENNAVYPNGEEMPIGNMPKEVMQTEEQPVGGAEPTAEEIGGFIREELGKLIEHYSYFLRSSSRYARVYFVKNQRTGVVFSGYGCLYREGYS